MAKNHEVKYSVLLPTFRRNVVAGKSIHLWLEARGDRTDVEIWLIDDAPDDPAYHIAESLGVNYCLCPQGIRGATLNIGAVAARGEYLVITGGAEIFPNTKQLFTLLDSMVSPEKYIGFSCYDEVGNCWRSHPTKANLPFHYGGCISREKYVWLGGIDDRYHKACCADDNDFSIRLQRGMPWEITTDILVTHGVHPLAHTFDCNKKFSGAPPELLKKYEYNMELYTKCRADLSFICVPNGWDYGTAFVHIDGEDQMVQLHIKAVRIPLPTPVAPIVIPVSPHIVATSKAKLPALPMPPTPPPPLPPMSQATVQPVLQSLLSLLESWLSSSRQVLGIGNECTPHIEGLRRHTRKCQVTLLSPNSNWQLPFAVSTFDAVWCTQEFEVSSPSGLQAAQEIKRVLRHHMVAIFTGRHLDSLKWLGVQVGAIHECGFIESEKLHFVRIRRY